MRPTMGDRELRRDDRFGEGELLAGQTWRSCVSDIISSLSLSYTHKLTLHARPLAAAVGPSISKNSSRA